jgi:glutathione S-transferase
MASESFPADAEGLLNLMIRMSIRASAERLFNAWTQPDQLKKWWGPVGVKCISAEIDLQVGGCYRIGNELPDGRVIWISGKFELIEEPRKLIYSWRVEGDSGARERVTVCFESQGESTEVVVVHERIPDGPTRAQHEQGWLGCLDGLADYLRGR